MKNTAHAEIGYIPEKYGNDSYYEEELDVPELEDVVKQYTKNIKLGKPIEEYHEQEAGNKWLTEVTYELNSDDLAKLEAQVKRKLHKVKTYYTNTNSAMKERIEFTDNMVTFTLPDVGSYLDAVMKESKDMFAKVTGDNMKYKEFLLSKLLEAKKEKRTASAKQIQAALDTMDQTPENDEEELDEIYELPGDIADQLAQPVSASVAELKGVMADLAGNKFYKLDENTFGLKDDVHLNKLMDATDATLTDKRITKVGLDRVYMLDSNIGKLQVTVDFRGYVDSVTAL